MAGVVPPLTTRLRYRFQAVVWLLALVVITKGMLASLCITDGLTQSSPMIATASAIADASPIDVDEDAVPCWHAGAGGCHCSCVHASALPMTASVLPAGPLARMRLTTLAAPPPHVLLPPTLRPPIA